ncbi:MAG: MmcQ/YjbR family DNA-binding protein [Pseudomonadales bacterium]|nr:MmcQ/YjbR family DNA-binding protein [Pseudomonadales bacterium]
MTTWNKISKLSLGFPETEEHNHLGTPAIRVKGKIFVQRSADDNESILVKLSKPTQSSLIEEDEEVFSAPSHWGKFGWTNIKFSKVKESNMSNIIEESWITVAPKSLSKKREETT